MRIVPLLAGLLLATALVSLAPGAGATADCVTVDAGGLVDQTVCTDPCAYRSDCCDAAAFWCPETE